MLDALGEICLNTDTHIYALHIDTYTYIRIRYHHHHHHHVVPLARISLTLSRHFSQSFIASGRSSRLHLVSSHSCIMYVRTGRPAFAWPYVVVHRSTSLMSSSLLLQQCPACLVRLTIRYGHTAVSWHISFSLSANSCVSIPNSPKENVAYEFVLFSLSVSSVFGSHYSDGWLYGR